MPIMCIYRVRNATPADYDAVREKVRWEEDPPAGGIAHFLSFTGDGAVEFDVWESRAAFEAFWMPRMKPALKALGIDMGEPEILDLQGVAIADAVMTYQMPRTVTPLVESDARA
jgi:hypothetical protein